MESLYFTTAIVQQNSQAEGDAPAVTVFTFPDDETAAAFPHGGERLRADDPRIPPFGANGVQYEPHGFEGGFGVEPAALVSVTTTQTAAEAAYNQLEAAAPAAVAALLDGLETALDEWTLWGCPRIQHACDERNLQCAEIIGWPILADADRNDDFGYAYAWTTWERRATHVLLSGGTLASLQREETLDGDYWTATPIDAADFPPADLERLTQTIQRAIAAHVAAVTERATENTRLAALAERLAVLANK